MDVKDLLIKYVNQPRVMQLASVGDAQPWVCSVHFFADDELNFYWCSTPERRHSKEIAHNQRVAAAVVVHEDTPNEPYVIGISVEGGAVLANQKDIGRIGDNYIQKLGKDPSLLQDILAGRNPHCFYRLTPTKNRAV